MESNFRKKIKFLSRVTDTLFCPVSGLHFTRVAVRPFICISCVFFRTIVERFDLASVVNHLCSYRSRFVIYCRFAFVSQSAEVICWLLGILRYIYTAHRKDAQFSTSSFSYAPHTPRNRHPAGRGAR